MTRAAVSPGTPGRTLTVSLPFYIDDPLVDRAAHRLALHTDGVESAARGYRARFGSCSCGEWTTPTWDDSAVLEAFDSHMSNVQVAVHAAPSPGGPQRRHGSRAAVMFDLTEYRIEFSVQRQRSGEGDFTEIVTSPRSASAPPAPRRPLTGHRTPSAHWSSAASGRPSPACPSPRRSRPRSWRGAMSDRWTNGHRVCGPHPRTGRWPH